MAWRIDFTKSADKVWYIADRSKLAQCLDLWFELHNDTRENKVRGYTPYTGGFLFVTGANYSIFSRDLCGNYYSDETKNVFAAFCEAVDEALNGCSARRYIGFSLGARESSVIEHLKTVKCLQSADTGHAVVQFVADDNSEFTLQYDTTARRWGICG